MRNILSPLNSSDNCLVENIRYVVGDGKRIQFWTYVWIGEQALKLSFPRVYALACQKTRVIADFGHMTEGVWVWIILLRRSLFDWEMALWDSFLNLISNFRSNNLCADNICWKGNSNGLFSVKSCCKISGPNVSVVDAVWNSVWSNLAPPTIEAFVWKAIHSRLPTKVNLSNSGCLQHSSLLCVLCGLYPETTDHLFCHYSVVIETDSKFVADWLENTHRCPIIFKSLIEACLKECNDPEWRVSCVPRECNSLTDSLAKKGIVRSHDMYSMLKL
ncbi:hypothetical protein V6N13_020045 [Hibiscus sabdariffa]